MIVRTSTGDLAVLQAGSGSEPCIECGWVRKGGSSGDPNNSTCRQYKSDSWWIGDSFKVGMGQAQAHIGGNAAAVQMRFPDPDGRIHAENERNHREDECVDYF